MCLNSSIHAIYHLTHTIVLTYLVLCTHVQSTVIWLTKWAITPLDWIKMHPKSVPSSFIGAIILPHEINNVYGRFSRHIPGKM
jgi:hypothetical protein